MPKTFYITTPIYYPSGKPHIGNIYTNIVCDILARWHKLMGEEVFFTTGLDEHASNVEKAAAKAKTTPKKFVDKIAPSFKEAFKAYNIGYDKFVRTTDPKHKKFCQDIIQKVYDKGDIYKGKYEGWYCDSCETYYTEKDLNNKRCPLHKKKAMWLEEETYFFKMSKYQKRVEAYIKKQNYIFPSTRQKFLLGRMKEGVRDLSISRSNTKWGIPLPFDKKERAYVWFDALLNYTSSTEDQKYNYFWPANVHVTAHDIMWHHSVIWLSMLFAAGIKPPKKLLVHGFIKGEGGVKMSKSIGNVIDPLALLKTYPSDSVRYFLVREIPLGADGSFSYTALKDRHNNELVNDLGNLHARTLSMLEKYYKGSIPRSSKNELVKRFNFKKVQKHIDNFETHLALSEIWKFINICNKYINDKKPWELAKKESKNLDTVMYNLTESLRILSIVLQPFMPETAARITKSLGLKKQGTFKEIKFGLLGNNKLKKEEYLFSRIEEERKEKKMSAKTKGELLDAPHYFQFKDWEKVKLRVGKVVKIKKHPDADKLYVLLVDMGPGENKRQIVSGLVEYYKMSELLDKQVVVITNLQPRKFRGIESEGMLLAADFKNKVSLLQPDKKIQTGAKVC
tara:strand:- start:9409 stop:11271 length:1863 start_codon:yes stop_codon:yes gene_type:complete